MSMRLKVHRAPPLTATAPGVLFVRRLDACEHPTGSGAPAPISAAPGSRPQRRMHMTTHPTGTRAPTSTSPGVHPQRRHAHVSSFQGQSSSRSHFNTSRCPHVAASAQQSLSVSSSMSSSHGQPCSRAHFNTDKCPRFVCGPCTRSTYPTGNRAPEATSTPPGARPQRRTYSSS